MRADLDPLHPLILSFSLLHQILSVYLKILERRSREREKIKIRSRGRKKIKREIYTNWRRRGERENEAKERI